MTKRSAWLCRCFAFALLAFAATAGEAKTFRWANDGDPTTMLPRDVRESLSNPRQVSILPALVLVRKAWVKRLDSESSCGLNTLQVPAKARAPGRPGALVF